MSAVAVAVATQGRLVSLIIRVRQYDIRIFPTSHARVSGWLHSRDSADALCKFSEPLSRLAALHSEMMYDDGYDTDDTDELLAAKCSFQPTVVVSSSSKLQQKSSGPAASTSGPAEACTIVEDEDWLFSISASSSRPSSAGTCVSVARRIPETCVHPNRWSDSKREMLACPCSDTRGHQRPALVLVN